MRANQTSTQRGVIRINRSKAVAVLPPTLAKCPTGIRGLDEITSGGLPRGRPTLVCGGAGCGKTLLGMEFLVRGIEEYGEPGVFMSFEEASEELAENVASLGFDLPALIAQNKLAIDHVTIERERDRGDRRIRPGGAVHPPRRCDRRGRRQARRARHDRGAVRRAAKPAILRAELRRLFRWLKEKGVTADHHRRAGRGHAHPPRPGGIRLRLRDPAGPPGRRPGLHAPAAHRQVSRLGARHQRIPVPDRRARHLRPADHLPRAAIPGVAGERLHRHSRAGRHARRRGLFPRQQRSWSPAPPGPARPASPRTSSRRPAGAASAASISPSRNRRTRSCATCARSASTSASGSRRACCTWSPPARRASAWRCTSATMLKLVDEFKPRIVIIDPISNFLAAGTPRDVRSMLMRLVDFLKTRQITALFTSLTGAGHRGRAERGRHLLADGHLAAAARPRAGGERNRTLSSSSRAAWRTPIRCASSLLTDQGVELADVFVGPDGDPDRFGAAGPGSRRRAAAAALEQDIARKQAAMARKRKVGRSPDRRDAGRARGRSRRVDMAMAEQAAGRGRTCCRSTAPRWRRHANARRRGQTRPARNGEQTMSTVHRNSPAVKRQAASHGA